jgi:hypothetical protein
MTVINDLGASEIIAIVSAVIAFVAMVIALGQAKSAKQQATEAKRQADAALGEVNPLIFLDSGAFDPAETRGGCAELTFVNQNRRDIRLLDIEIKTDPAIFVSNDTGQTRDFIAALVQHIHNGEGASIKIDLRQTHIIVQGSSIGVAGSRYKLPLSLTPRSNQNYTKETAEIQAIVRFVLLDARHTEQQVEVSAIVPFRA